MKPSPSEAKVLESAGIKPGEATEREITLAKNALDRCHYISPAGRELSAMLGGRAYWGPQR